MRNTLLNILLPPLCVGCKKEGAFICGACRSKIQEYNYFICPICKKRTLDGRLDSSCRKESGLTRFFGAPLPYDNEVVKNLIHAFKYKRVKSLAEPLGKILIEFLDKNQISDYIKKYERTLVFVPVPLYPCRERDRGFNQSFEIAKRMSQHYQIPLLSSALRKQKNTHPQADIKDKEKRALNIAGAFSCSNPELVQKKIVILIDDVYTSGSTMRECARVLRSAGVRQVWGITVARG